MNPVFLPKEDQALPDSYGLKVFYINGKTEEFELAQHFPVKETGIFDAVTKDDIWIWIPMNAVQRFEFDKRFSKIVDIQSKMQRKAS